MNDISIAVIVSLVFCLRCFARTIILCLEAKVKETDIYGDDTVERFGAESIEIPFLKREAGLKK